MAQTYKTEGIILKRWYHKERDKMVRVFTRDFGKITGRAISARKVTSKLAGHLEPFIAAEMFFAKSKTIDIVAGSSTIVSHARLRESIHHAAAASFFAEVVDKFTQEREPDEQLYDMIGGVLNYLNGQKTVNILVVYAAIIQIVEHLGYRLELYSCHQCKRTIAPGEATKIHYLLWSVECENCKSIEDVALMSDEVIKTLRYIQDHDFDSIARLTMSPKTWQDIDMVVRRLLQYHIDGAFHSEQVFLEMVSQPDIVNLEATA